MANDPTWAQRFGHASTGLQQRTAQEDEEVIDLDAVTDLS